jgi:hypothetical protein
MRKLISALALGFAMASLAPIASAGENCDWGGYSVKKSDLETPPPAALPVPATVDNG